MLAWLGGSKRRRWQTKKAKPSGHANPHSHPPGHVPHSNGQLAPQHRSYSALQHSGVPDATHSSIHPAAASTERPRLQLGSLDVLALATAGLPAGPAFPHKRSRDVEPSQLNALNDHGQGNGHQHRVWQAPGDHPNAGSASPGGEPASRHHQDQQGASAPAEQHGQLFPAEEEEEEKEQLPSPAERATVAPRLGLPFPSGSARRSEAPPLPPPQAQPQQQQRQLHSLDLLLLGLR